MDLELPSTKNLPPWLRKSCLAVPVTKLPGCPSDKWAAGPKPPVWIQLCPHRFVPSCAGGRATVPGCHRAVPTAPRWSWMGVAAARSVPGAWESPATSCTSVTRARASSVTTAQRLRGREAPATVSTGCPLSPGVPPQSSPAHSPAPAMASHGYRHPAAPAGEWVRRGEQLS